MELLSEIFVGTLMSKLSYHNVLQGSREIRIQTFPTALKFDRHIHFLAKHYMLTGSWWIYVQNEFIHKNTSNEIQENCILKYFSKNLIVSLLCPQSATPHMSCFLRHNYCGS